MNRTGRILFILGILISFIAGSGVFLLLLLAQPKAAEVSTTKLVIAFQEIAPRSEITAEQVGLTNWPRALPTPVGAFDNVADVVGKISTTAIYPGSPVLSKMLVDQATIDEKRSTAALILDKGSVGTAIPVNLKSSVAEALQAGDRVDVIATFRSQSTNPNTANQIATQRLLADVLVLQVGPWPQKQGQGSGAGLTIITVQLKEQDALILEYAVLHADAITLALRPANDHELLPLEPVTFDYINQKFGFKLPR